MFIQNTFVFEIIHFLRHKCMVSYERYERMDVKIDTQKLQPHNGVKDFIERNRRIHKK